MNIRKATLTDYWVIDPILVELELHHVVLEPDFFMPIEHYDRELFDSYIDQDDKSMFVAEEEGSITGVAIVALGHWQAVNIFHQRDFAVVEELSVLPTFRRQGIGTALMEAAETWAKQKGVDQMQLSVWAKNTEAIHLYEELGYQCHLQRYHKQLHQ